MSLRVGQGDYKKGPNSIFLAAPPSHPDPTARNKNNPQRRSIRAGFAPARFSPAKYRLPTAPMARTASADAFVWNRRFNLTLGPVVSVKMVTACR